MAEEGNDVSNAAHLAAMWAGQSNVLVAVRIRPVLTTIYSLK